MEEVVDVVTVVDAVFVTVADSVLTEPVTVDVVAVVVVMVVTAWGYWAENSLPEDVTRVMTT